MKTKKLFLMVAMLLMGVGAFAQNGNSQKGDVNGDGIVDVADIVAIIEIIKNGGQGEEQQAREGYYWYAGQDHPSTNNKIVPDTDLESPGWRFTGTTLDADYEFNTTDNNIADNPTRRATWYIALPVNSQYYLWDDQHTEILNSYYETNETLIFHNVNYNIYHLASVTARALGGIYISK